MFCFLTWEKKKILWCLLSFLEFFTFEGIFLILSSFSKNQHSTITKAPLLCICLRLFFIIISFVSSEKRKVIESEVLLFTLWCPLIRIGFFLWMIRSYVVSGMLSDYCWTTLKHLKTKGVLLLSVFFCVLQFVSCEPCLKNELVQKY